MVEVTTREVYADMKLGRRKEYEKLGFFSGLTARPTYVRISALSGLFTGN